MCKNNKVGLNDQSIAPSWILDLPGLVGRRKGPEDTIQGWLILLELVGDSVRLVATL